MTPWCSSVWFTVRLSTCTYSCESQKLFQSHGKMRSVALDEKDVEERMEEGVVMFPRAFALQSEVVAEFVSGMAVSSEWVLLSSAGGELSHITLREQQELLLPGAWVNSGGLFRHGVEVWCSVIIWGACLCFCRLSLLLTEPVIYKADAPIREMPTSAQRGM